MLITYWRTLQLFAEGGDGATGGEGSSSAATVVASGDDGQQKLRDLGVPEDVLKRHMARRSHGGTQSETAPQQQAQPQDQQEVVPPAQEEHPTESNEGLSLKDYLKTNPKANAEMQEIVKSRIKEAKGSVDALNEVDQILSIVSGQYDIKLDRNNPQTYKDLAAAFRNDPTNYQDIALEKGITSQEAMQEEKEARQQQEWNDHFTELDRQAEELRQFVPNFDLWAEMQNPVFAHVTAPGGFNVEQAYYGLYHKDMQQALAQATAAKTREQVAAAIQSGSMRPVESGSARQAPSVTTFNYATASKDQREAFKAQLRRAWNRGETVYPGQRR